MKPPAIGSVSAPAKGADTGPIYQSAGTRRMEERLRAIFAGTDWKLDPSKPGLRVEYYSEVLRKNKLSLEQDTLVREQLAREMLGAGDSDGSIRELEEVRRRWQHAQRSMPPDGVKQLGKDLAISYLRLGEQENCAMLHGQRACLFPLRASAVHQMPRRAEGAVRELTALLEKDAADTQSQWLLNVAYMQLGRYPKDVPPRWLIPASRFESEAKLPEFAEIAASAGVDIMGHAGGVVVEDFDGDGLLDIMVSSSGPLDQMHLFHNNGDGSFTDVTRKSGLMGETGGLNLVLTDYNNDGHPDVLVLRGGWWGKQGCYPMSLLRNNGNGTFDDVTEEAGLLSVAPTNTGAWADFDGDGWLDLFVGHESQAGDRHPSQLFHNNHDGTFTEIGAASGLDELGFVKGVAWGDYNNDGRPDLYVSVMNGRNHLFRNDGPRDSHDISKGWRFTDVTAAAGVGKQSNSFATWFFDYDNDGWPDIFVAGYSLASSADIGAFEMGLPVSAEKPKLYRNMHDGSFHDVTSEVHLDRAILTMGANFGDLDNDGDMDIVVNCVNALPQLLRCDSAVVRNWIKIKLVGKKSNRTGIGARITVTATTAPQDVSGVCKQPMRQIDEVRSGGSYYSQNDLRIHFGLDQAVKADVVEIAWPSGVKDVLHDLAANHLYVIEEGGKILKTVAMGGASTGAKPASTAAKKPAGAGE